MSYRPAKVFSFRLHAPDRATLEEASVYFSRPSRSAGWHSSRAEGFSEFVRRMALEHAAQLLQERKTRLEQRPTPPAVSDDARHGQTRKAK